MLVLCSLCLVHFYRKEQKSDNWIQPWNNIKYFCQNLDILLIFFSFAILCVKIHLETDLGSWRSTNYSLILIWIGNYLTWKLMLTILCSTSYVYLSFLIDFLWWSCQLHRSISKILVLLTKLYQIVAILARMECLNAKVTTWIWMQMGGNRVHIFNVIDWPKWG